MMAQSPSRAVKLFGTDKPPAEIRILTAGLLSVQLEAGNLRYIRYGGVEVLRALSYVVRDAVWGTYNPVFTNMVVSEDIDRFEVTYDAVCSDAQQSIAFTAKIVGSSDGTLRYESEATAITDFNSNRVGFVVLHGPDGGDVEVEHVDGSIEQSVFPKEVTPWQPFFNIRTLTHEPVPGLKVACRMEGDTYEMEDHRNWTDASFKTYVRPLAAPAPFTTKAKEGFSQSVTITISGSKPSVSISTDEPIVVQIGNPAGKMPRIGLGVHPRRAESAMSVAKTLKQLGPQLLVCHMDPRDGHGHDALLRFKALGEATSAKLALELIVPCEDNYQEELENIGKLVRNTGIDFEAIAVAPGPDLLAGRPFSDWPKVPPLGDLYEATRRVFPGTPIGGGTFSFFTELNRRRPPANKIDFLTHLTSAIVHAADDFSVIETLTALPYVINTARTIAPDKPYRVGPAAIGARHTPFGGEPTKNPDGERITMVRLDPRQRGLLGAAWHLGYIARMAEGGIDVLSMSAPTGEFGVIYHPMEFPQAWFDDVGGVFPAYHVLAGAAQAAGSDRLTTAINNPETVQAYAWQRGSKITLWLANLTSHEQAVLIEGLTNGQGRLRMLDETSFELCAGGMEGFNKTAQDANSGQIILAPYAIASLEGKN